MDFLKYFEYAPTIAVLIALVYIVKIFIGVIKNHIGDSTRANQRLADAIQQMLSFMERNFKK